MSVIELKDISKIYGFGDATTVALDSVSLVIERGEFVAIMGPSGSGKSTLMNVIGLLDRPTHGTYHLDGRLANKVRGKARAKVRREKIGFIFQTFNLLKRMNVVENVALPLMYKGTPHVKRLNRAAKVLKSVGLEDRQYYMPNQLSGGQVQRVAVARALVNKPSMVLADEPTGNLDTKSSENIMNLLKEVHDNGNTIVMITHNPELAKYADRIITLVDGKIDSDTATAKRGKTKSSDAAKSSKADKKKSSKKSGKKSSSKGSKSKKSSKKNISLAFILQPRSPSVKTGPYGSPSSPTAMTNLNSAPGSPERSKPEKRQR